MLIELLRPAGPELGRRWLAALLLAPAAEREAIVSAVEKRMLETYGRASHTELIHLREAPVQREGHVEQLVRTFERVSKKSAAKASRRSAG